MGLRWKNKRQINLLLIFVLILLSSCKTKKATIKTDTREDRKRTEIITRRNPFKLESVTLLQVDSLGIINPTKLKLDMGSTSAIVSIKDNEVTYSLEDKDTVITKTETIDVSVKEKVVTETESENLTWWGKIKKKVNTWGIYSLIFNIIMIALWISKKLKRAYLPI